MCLKIRIKNEALAAIANQLISETAYILEENKRDIEEGKAKGFSDSLLDRLMLTENRIIDMTEGIKQLIELRDPVGECVSAWESKMDYLFRKCVYHLVLLG